jgi:hypothetical protein
MSRDCTRVPRLIVYMAINPGVELNTKQLAGLMGVDANRLHPYLKLPLASGLLERCVTGGAGAGKQSSYCAGETLHKMIAEARVHAQAIAAARSAPPEAAAP